ncbi:MAG: DUF1127 domain-containing protein [Pseudomonadota bacterium]
MAYLSETRLAGGLKTRRIGLREYLSLYRERRALSHLDDHLLQDIGISRHDAQTEAERPVWDAPQRWMR